MNVWRHSSNSSSWHGASKESQFRTSLTVHGQARGDSQELRQHHGPGSGRSRLLRPSRPIPSNAKQATASDATAKPKQATPNPSDAKQAAVPKQPLPTPASNPKPKQSPIEPKIAATPPRTKRFSMRKRTSKPSAAFLGLDGFAAADGGYLTKGQG